MSAQNAKQDCRFLLRPFFVIFAAQGFGITGGTAPRLSACGRLPGSIPSVHLL
jgi:hypothetical protein